MIYLICYLLINAFITGLMIATTFPNPKGKELKTAFLLSLFGIFFSLPIIIFIKPYDYVKERYWRFWDVFGLLWNFRMFNKENISHMVLVKYYLRENDYPNSPLKSIRKLLHRKIAKRCGLILTGISLSTIISRIEKAYSTEEYSLRALYEDFSDDCGGDSDGPNDIQDYKICEKLYPSIYNRTSEWTKEQLKYSIYCEYSDLIQQGKIKL